MKLLSQVDSNERVKSIEVYIVYLEQSVPYLGSLRAGESVNERGYFVRQGNKTVYPLVSRSLVVRVETTSGVEGWGETYGLVAPKATAEIINDLLAGFVLGQNPQDCEAIHDRLYDLMRVRGYTGGFYLDALAAIDIALWDITGKIQNKSIGEILGGQRHTKLAAYVSGLPRDTLSDRCELAKEWQRRGFESFKFALPVADDGVEAELGALRNTLGESALIAADLHWSLEADQAIELSHRLVGVQPWFLEAPVAPENLQALGEVAASAACDIAAGEEWRTLFEAKLRLDNTSLQIVQPEMGHTGVTQFVRIGKYGEKLNRTIIPHATIGAGIFLAASLQVSSALRAVPSHEFQHSVFLPFKHFLREELICENGFYSIPSGPGLGVEPSAAMREHMELVT